MTNTTEESSRDKAELQNVKVKNEYQESSENRQCSGIWQLRQKLKDKQYRRKLIHSLWIAVALFALGMTESQAGPTFLDLQIITNTNVGKASVFFTSRGCGVLTGAITSGLIGSKINQNLVICLCMIVMALTTIATPFCSIYGLMICVKYIGGVSVGLLNTSANAAHLKIWGNDGRVLMQLIHFSCAIGGVFAPLVTEPFLAARSDVNSNTTMSRSTWQAEKLDFINASIGINYSIQETNGAIESYEPSSIFVKPLSNLTLISGEVSVETKVHFAFLIVGIISFVGAFPFLVLFIQNRSKKTTESGIQTTGCRSLPVSLRICMILCSCAIFFVYTFIEGSSQSFLMTFVIREFSFVSKSRGAYITAILKGSFAASRFLMIFVSNVLTSLQLLFMCVFLMAIAAACLTVSASYAAITPLTVFTGMAGLGMSAVFPAALSWIDSELLKLNSRVSSYIFISASVGSMVYPLMLAFLMEEFTNMWFCYSLLIEVGVLGCILVFLVLFNRWFVNIKYGTFSSIEHNISQSLEASETSRQAFLESGREQK